MYKIQLTNCLKRIIPRFSFQFALETLLSLFQFMPCLEELWDDHLKETIHNPLIIINSFYTFMLFDSLHISKIKYWMALSGFIDHISISEAEQAAQRIITWTFLFLIPYRPHVLFRYPGIISANA